MNLELQIQSLIFSFLFGLFFALMFNLLYKYLFKGKNWFRLITNIIFVFFHTILYFSLLTIINDGRIHIYFILMLSLGFIIGNKKIKKIRRYRLEIL